MLEKNKQKYNKKLLFYIYTWFNKEVLEEYLDNISKKYLTEKLANNEISIRKIVFPIYRDYSDQMIGCIDDFIGNHFDHFFSEKKRIEILEYLRIELNDLYISLLEKNRWGFYMLSEKTSTLVVEDESDFKSQQT
jgi:hypothetical protein